MFFLAAVAMVPPSSAAEAPAVVVGRVFHIEGDLLRYVPEVKDWVAVVRMRPSARKTHSSRGTGGWQS